jgi:hypothetical protein
MKTLLKVCGSILVFLVLLLLVLRVTGFEPRECRNYSDSWRCKVTGLWLRGNLVTTPVTDWSFAENLERIKIQTRTWYLLPHSVYVSSSVSNSQLYVMASPGLDYKRVWAENVARDPHVRLKIGDQLFDRTLSLVTDPVEKEAALQALYKNQGPGHHSKLPRITFRVMPE